MTGRHRLSKRQVQATTLDLLGRSISTGMVSKAERRADLMTAVPVLEVARGIATSPTLNVDKTGWREAHKRAPVRRICWVHLRRDFQAMFQRTAGGREVGSKLLALSDRIFEVNRRWWAGAIRRTTLRGHAGWMRPAVRRNLEAGRDGPRRWTAKVCRQLLAVEAGNDAAERALRHGMIWRRISGGTDGERGSRFVGQLLSVVATCRQRGRDVLGYLTECFYAHFEGRPAPSLMS